MYVGMHACDLSVYVYKRKLAISPATPFFSGALALEPLVSWNVAVSASFEAVGGF